MSPNGHTKPGEVKGNAAAYVLGALEPEEAAVYRRHLAACASCRDGVAALTTIADALATAVPQYAPPSDLRRRVLREVRGQSGVIPRAARRQWGPPSVWAPGARRLAVAATIAIACLAIVLTSIVGAGGRHGSRVIAARVIGIGGAAQLRIGEHHTELVVTHLPPPGPGHIYELWLQHGTSRPTPTDALFSVSATGGADVAVPGDLDHVSQVLVTEEPTGGRAVSTHPPVIVASVT
jgi:anti-sigma-K factor RskA